MHIGIAVKEMYDEHLLTVANLQLTTEVLDEVKKKMGTSGGKADVREHSQHKDEPAPQISISIDGEGHGPKAESL